MVTVAELQQVARYRFSVDEYHRMGAVGIFKEDDRVELIDGEILTMSPIGRRHVVCVDRLNAFLSQGLGRRAIVRVQSSVILSDRSEPEPDVALIRPRADFYANSDPTAEDIFTLIEVKDSSASYDRGPKLAFYAREGIAEVWLVDLNVERIEVYRRPLMGVHTDNLVCLRGQTVSPEAFPDLVLAVDDILG